MFGKKISLANMQGKMSRIEMRAINGGATYGYPYGPGGTTGAGGCKGSAPWAMSCHWAPGTERAGQWTSCSVAYANCDPRWFDNQNCNCDPNA